MSEKKKKAEKKERDINWMENRFRKLKVNI